MNSERKYVAISIKHTQYKWKFGMPCWLWGYHQTEDDEPRCFSGYTEYLDKAERYSVEDWEGHYSPTIVRREPVSLSADFCKKWKEYDSVLVEAEQYEQYCKLAGIPLCPSEKES